MATQQSLFNVEKKLGPEEVAILFTDLMGRGRTVFYTEYRPYLNFTNTSPVKKRLRIPERIAVGCLRLLCKDYDPAHHPSYAELRPYLKTESVLRDYSDYLVKIGIDLYN